MKIYNIHIDQTNEMILLADSDLYAVINYLTIIGHSRINKIWVQISIKQKFLTLIKKYFRLKDFTIRIFRSTREFAPRMSCSMNITSIWSEDIVGAKDLTTFLDVCILFKIYNSVLRSISFIRTIKIISVFNYSERCCIHKYLHGSLWWCHAFALC